MFSTSGGVMLFKRVSRRANSLICGVTAGVGVDTELAGVLRGWKGAASTFRFNRETADVASLADGVVEPEAFPNWSFLPTSGRIPPGGFEAEDSPPSVPLFRSAI